MMFVLNILFDKTYQRYKMKHYNKYIDLYEREK